MMAKPLPVRSTLPDKVAAGDLVRLLRANEERHQIISELASDYIYSMAIHQNGAVEINCLSGSVQHITSYTIEEIRNLDGGWNGMVDPEDLPAFRSSWVKVLANETLAQEYRILTKGGKVRWLRDYKKPVWDGIEGRVTFVWGAVQDITAHKRVEEKLIQHTAELEARNKELDAFAHTVSHDLKNPLGIIMGYARLLADDTETSFPANMRHSITAIEKAANKMNDIMDDLLLLAGVGRVAVEIQPLDMANIMTGVWHMLGPMSEAYQAIITVPDTWPVALGYAPWIEIVWTNYASNAMKYGGRPPRIELGATVQPEGMVRFWVRDNGPGLTPDERSLLFVPFTRLAPDVAEGNGVGLSIVQRIVERLGGQISIESESGRGSIFSFSLPGVAG